MNSNIKKRFENMDTFYFTVADFNFKLNFGKIEWPDIKERLKRGILYILDGFLLPQKPQKVDFVIHFSWEEWSKILYVGSEKESYISTHKYKTDRLVNCSYKISIIQFETVLEDILARLLSTTKGMILHASAVKVEDSSYIFLGHSGAGKTTIKNLLADKYPPLVDDRVIVRLIDRKYHLYQTPFHERESVKKDTKKYKVGRLFLLKKSQSVEIDKIQNKDILLQYFVPTFYPEQVLKNKILKNILSFIGNCEEFYYLYFRKNKKEVQQYFTHFISS